MGTQKNCLNEASDQVLYCLLGNVLLKFESNLNSLVPYREPSPIKNQLCELSHIFLPLDEGVKHFVLLESDAEHN